jgi:hypothetical protein
MPGINRNSHLLMLQNSSVSSFRSLEFDLRYLPFENSIKTGGSNLLFSSRVTALVLFASDQRFDEPLHQLL